MAARSVKSEVAGTVWKIAKRAGDRVAVDEAIIILECMKMEIPILAPIGGRIEAINVDEGDTVAEGQLVIVIAT